jgi:sulfur carrier protein
VRPLETRVRIAQPGGGSRPGVRGTSEPRVAERPMGGEWSSGLKIIVNGEEREVPGEITLGELLRELALAQDGVAIELNGALVPRARFAAQRVQPGDRLEIVTFVGGG